VKGPTAGNVVEASHKFSEPPSVNRKQVVRIVALREFKVDKKKDPPSCDLGNLNVYTADQFYGCLLDDGFTIICEVTATVRPDRTVLGSRNPPLNEPKILGAAKHKRRLQVKPKNSSLSEQNEIVNACQKSQEQLQNEQGFTLTTSQNGQQQNQDKTLATSQKCQQLNQQLENSFR
jgi:hypothetical protein